MFGKAMRWMVIGLFVLVVVITAMYFWDMNRAYARIQGKTKVIASPYGEIEYTEIGSGQPVLVIHGSGGGFDQGELVARAVLNEQFRAIIPSRFGYLRSTFREGATFDDQAHAYSFLLNQLGVKQVAVIALSHGGPSALLFAVLHPEQVSSLTLISCGVASSTNADQAQANMQGDMLATIFKYDPLYWGITKLFKKPFMELMGANDAVIAGLSPAQQVLVDELIDGMNPVSPRSAGATFDNQAKMPNERIGAIRAPTLIFHAVDDTLQVFRNAEYASTTIPGARLVRFEKGGHIVLSVEQATIQRLAQKHILDNANK